MVREYDVFDEEYPVESSTDIAGKIAFIGKEEEEKNQTITGQPGYYDKTKPYRYYIKAKVIE